MYTVGIMLKTTTYEAIFLLELFIYAAAILYVIVVIQDQVGKEGEELGAGLTRVGVFGTHHVKDMVMTVFRQRDNGHRQHVVLLLLAATAMYYGLAGEEAFSSVLEIACDAILEQLKAIFVICNSGESCSGVNFKRVNRHVADAS